MPKKTEKKKKKGRHPGFDAMKHKGLWKDLLLLIMVVLVFCLVAEGVFRVLVVKETNWFGNGEGTDEFYESIQKNSLGFRDKDHPETKRPGTMRVAMLGDSFLFGSAVPDDDLIFPNILEKKLNSGAERYELMNLGWPGANTAGEIAMFQRLYPVYDFDRAILFFFLNDAEASLMGDGAQFFYRHIIPGAAGEWLIDNSLFYYFLETRTYKLLERLGLRHTYNDYVISLYESDSPDLRIHRAQFSRFLSDFRQGTIAVVIIPILKDLDDYQFTAAHDYVRGVAAEHGILVIDLLDAFQGMDAGGLIVNPYDYHFNEKAHGIAADHLYEKFLESGFFAAVPMVNPEI